MGHMTKAAKKRIHRNAALFYAARLQGSIAHRNTIWNSQQTPGIMEDCVKEAIALEQKADHAVLRLEAYKSESFG